jgi:class 3 adenylate cyclase
MMGRDEIQTRIAARHHEPYSSFRAIAFADVVASSILTDGHEIEAFHYLRRVLSLLRRQARAYRGRIVEEAGDGALAAFPEADQAVGWALACHRDMAGLQRPLSSMSSLSLRIGIHAGPVLVYGNRLFGRSLVVACRIQQAAAPGETLVTASLLEHLSDAADLEFVPSADVPIKGTLHRWSTFRISTDSIIRDKGWKAGWGMDADMSRPHRPGGHDERWSAMAGPPRS